MRPLPPLIRWNRSATVLLSGFFLVILLIIYVWWPLAEELLAYIDWHGPWWLYMDWLLIGLFVFMSLTIVSRADLRRDGLILFVATLGGLVIEAWGTQTNLWFYYTSERPPLWIFRHGRSQLFPLTASRGRCCLWPREAKRMEAPPNALRLHPAGGSRTGPSSPRSW